MTVMNNITGHFKERLAGGLRKITVPEWKTDIYYKGAYPFAVESKIIALQQQNKTVEALVESLILKALDPECVIVISAFASTCSAILQA